MILYKTTTSEMIKILSQIENKYKVDAFNFNNYLQKALLPQLHLYYAKFLTNEWS